MKLRYLGFLEIIGLLLSAVIVLLGLFVHRVFFAAFIFVTPFEIIKITYFLTMEEGKR
jgi:hypothetical protein